MPGNTYYSDPTDHLHLPPEVPIVWEPANGLIPLNPEAGVTDAKIRFRWYIPADHTTPGGAAVFYDIWWSTLASGAMASGPSLIGGGGGLSGMLYTEAPTQVVAPGDEGLVEFAYPLAPPPPGYDCFNAAIILSGSIHPPLGGSPGQWSQTAVFTGTYKSAEGPPWPYTDPHVNAGDGPWATVRFRTH